MAYTNDGSSDLSTVRTLIYDITDAASPTRGSDYFFEDTEIEAIIDQNSADLWLAASDLCASLAAKFAAESINLGLGKGDIKIDKTSRSKFYLGLAKNYRQQSGSDVVEFFDSVNSGVNSIGVDMSEYVGDF